MSVDDLKVSAMKVPSMNDALKTKNIDGMITFEPYVSIATANGANLLADSADILPNHPCCVVVASDKFIDEHPNETQTILKIHENATDFINDKIAEGKTSEVVDLLPADIVSNKDTEADSLESFPFLSGLDDSYKQDILDFMDLEVDLGVLKQPLSPDKIFYQ